MSLISCSYGKTPQVKIKEEEKEKEEKKITGQFINNPNSETLENRKDVFSLCLRLPAHEAIFTNTQLLTLPNP